MPILAWEPSLTLVGILFATGIVLAVAELFIPSHGVLTVLSVCGFVASVVVAFMLGQTAGVAVLLAVVLLAPLLLYVAVRVWPHTPVARKIILNGPSAVAKAGDLARLKPEELVGQVGVAKTGLRPAGKMALGDRQVDCVTEGDMVAKGAKVRIIAVHGARVVVRPLGETESSA